MVTRIFCKRVYPKLKIWLETLTFHAFEIEGVEGDLIDIDVLPNRSHDCFLFTGE